MSKNKRISLFLNDQEQKNLESLVRKYGGPASKILKEALGARFDDAFPPHKMSVESVQKIVTGAIPLEEMTPEQMCEQIEGSKIIRGPDGSRVCQFPEGNFTTMVSLSLIGDKGYTPGELNERIRKNKRTNI